MKKFMSIASVLLLALTGCGSNYSADDFNANQIIKSTDLTNTDEIVGSSVDIVGIMEDENLKASDGTYHSIISPIDGDPITDKYITAPVEVYNPEGMINAVYGDYLEITGVVTSIRSDDSEFAGDPIIEVVESKPLTETEALSPALKTIDVNQSQLESGVSLTLEAVEFSPVETRLSISIDNQTDYEADISDYEAKLTVDGKVYDSGSDFWSEDTVELPNSTKPNDTSEGVIVFPAVDYQNISNVKFTIQGDLNDDNWTNLSYSIETSMK